MSRAARPSRRRRRCAAVKLDAAARAVTAHVSCQARALQKNDSRSAPAVTRSADRRLDAAFARIEARGGCRFTGDEGCRRHGGRRARRRAPRRRRLTGRCGAIKLRLAAQKAARRARVPPGRRASRRAAGAGVSRQSRRALPHGVRARGQEGRRARPRGDAPAVQADRRRVRRRDGGTARRRRAREPQRRRSPAATCELPVVVAQRRVGEHARAGAAAL